MPRWPRRWRRSRVVLSAGTRGHPAFEGGRDPRVVAVSSFVAHTFRTDTRCSLHRRQPRRRLEALVARWHRTGASGVTVNAVVPGFIRKDPGAHAAIDPERLRRQVASVPLGRVGCPTRWRRRSRSLPRRRGLYHRTDAARRWRAGHLTRRGPAASARGCPVCRQAGPPLRET